MAGGINTIRQDLPPRSARTACRPPTKRERGRDHEVTVVVAAAHVNAHVPG